MGDWQDAWSVFRFNTHHGAAGSGHGGQFVSASGSNSAAAKQKQAAPKAGGKYASHSAGFAQAEKRRLTAKIQSDEAKIRVLEQQLHQQRAALKASAHAAAKAKSAHAAAKKAGHHKTAAAHHHKHATHHRHSVSHRKSIASLVHRIGQLRAQVTSLRKQRAAL